MMKSYKVRLFPTPEQEQIMQESINAARFVWNWGLAYQMERFKNGEKHLSGYDLKKELTKLKKLEGMEWLNKISAKTVSMAILDLDNAYQRFFKAQKEGEKFTKSTILKAKTRNRKLTPYDMKGHPKFKKKSKAKQSFYTRNENFYFMEEYIVLEKIGKIKYQTDHEMPVVKKKKYNTAKFTNPRVSYTNGKWILTFGMECENQAQELNSFAVGVDLGVKSLAVISYDGKKKTFRNINKTKAVRKLKKRLKHEKRNVSRKYQANGNYEKTGRIRKAESKVNDIYRKLSNIRLNYTHHVTSEIINLLPKTVVMENLNVTGMMKNKHLSEAIGEQGFHEFARQIEYKAEFNQIEVIKAGRFYPSSKKCCKCGNIKHDLKLKDRIYQCGLCGNVMDRDENASENLERLAY